MPLLMPIVQAGINDIVTSNVQDKEVAAVSDCLSKCGCTVVFDVIQPYPEIVHEGLVAEL